MVLQQMQSMDTDTAGQEVENSEEEEDSVLMRLQSTVDAMQVMPAPLLPLHCFCILCWYV